MEKTLLVLAAGMGSRYGGLKQMEGFGPNGETILEYSIYDALQAGFTKFVFVIRKSIEDDFRERILEKLPESIQIKLCFQELETIPDGSVIPDGRVKPWGTGHAVWVARNDIDGPFVLANGDDFYGRKSFVALSEYFDTVNNGSLECERHAMVAYPLGQTLSSNGSVSRGLCHLNESGELEGLEEISMIKWNEGVLMGIRGDSSFEIEETAPVSMNLFGFFPQIFRSIDNDLKAFMKRSGSELKSEFYIPEVVNGLIERKTASVDVLKTEEKWLGVTNPEDKDYVKEGIGELVKSGIYPAPLWG